MLTDQRKTATTSCERNAKPCRSPFAPLSLNEIAPCPKQGRKASPIREASVQHQKLVVMNEIAEGGFGKVHHCKYEGSSRILAVKIVQHNGEASRLADVAHEVGIHRTLFQEDLGSSSISENINSTFAVQLLEEIREAKRTLLVMELAHGIELQELVDNSNLGRLEDAECHSLSRLLIEAVAFFHSRGVAHCDIKPENIMVYTQDATESKLKLIDYGSSSTFSSSNTLVCELGGTEEYMAPERHWLEIDGTFDGAPSDIYSTGVCMFFMLVGEVPFDFETIGSFDEVQDQLDAGSIPFPAPEKLFLSDAWKDLVSQTMRAEPEDRPTAIALLKHPLFCTTHEHVRKESSSSSSALTNEITSPCNESSFSVRNLQDSLAELK